MVVFLLHISVFLAKLSKIQELTIFQEAFSNPKWTKGYDWRNYCSLNNTWTIVDLPPGIKQIGCKRVYRVKYHSDGGVERYN